MDPRFIGVVTFLGVLAVWIEASLLCAVLVTIGYWLPGGGSLASGMLCGCIAYLMMRHVGFKTEAERTPLDVLTAVVISAMALGHMVAIAPPTYHPWAFAVVSLLCGAGLLMGLGTIEDD